MQVFRDKTTFLMIENGFETIIGGILAVVSHIDLLCNLTILLGGR